MIHLKQNINTIYLQCDDNRIYDAISLSTLCFPSLLQEFVIIPHRFIAFEGSCSWICFPDLTSRDGEGFLVTNSHLKLSGQTMVQNRKESSQGGGEQP